MALDSRESNFANTTSCGLEQSKKLLLKTATYVNKCTVLLKWYIYESEMPAKIFIFRKGFKTSKHRLTRLLWGNGAGDMKLKSYSYVIPNIQGLSRIIKNLIYLRFGVQLIRHFPPNIEKYSTRHNIFNKALLFLDNAPNIQQI